MSATGVIYHFEMQYRTGRVARRVAEILVGLYKPGAVHVEWSGTVVRTDASAASVGQAQLQAHVRPVAIRDAQTGRPMYG